MSTKDGEKDKGGIARSTESILRHQEPLADSNNDFRKNARMRWEDGTMRGKGVPSMNMSDASSSSKDLR